MDSGATESNRLEWFLSYKKFDTVKILKLLHKISGGKCIQAIGSGDILTFLLSMEKNGCENISVIFVSELRFNLLTRDYDNIPTTKNAYEEWKYCCSGRKKSYS